MMFHLLNLVSGTCFVYLYVTRRAVVYARAR
jgi:hypothetical protein